MKITYDAEVDALYIEFRHTSVRTQHFTKEIAADFDEGGHLAGIEILDASQVLGDRSALRKVTLEGPAPGKT